MDEHRDIDAGLNDEEKGLEEEKVKDGGLLDQSKLGQSSDKIGQPGNVDDASNQGGDPFSERGTETRTRDGQGDFLFEKKLTFTDLSFLGISRQEVAGAAEHLPRPRNEDGSYTGDLVEILVSDVQSRTYNMSIRFSEISDSFMIINSGWTDFIAAHELQTGEMIRLYRVNKLVGAAVPEDDDDHLQHYLIECVKETDATTASGSSRKRKYDSSSSSSCSGGGSKKTGWLGGPNLGGMEG